MKNVVLHKIEDGELIEYSETPVSKEFEIHDFVEKHTKILGKDIFIIGREVRTVDGNFIDLLGLNSNGDTIIIEIKKDQTPRKVIAQILEYAEWISNSTGSDELNKIAKIKHLTKYPSLWKKYESEFGEIPDFNEHQQLFIVAEKIDPITEKLARYLRKNGIDIFCMELNFYEKNNHRFCKSEMIVGKEKAIIPDSTYNTDVNYDWRHYSQRRGWSDESISKMKKFVDEVMELSNQEKWDLDIKFNQRYCSIQTKSKYNLCALKERNGLIRIEFPPFRNKDEPPESDLNWKWSESQSFWQGNFAAAEMPSAKNIKHILTKSYDSLTKDQLKKKHEKRAEKAVETRKSNTK